MRLGAAPVIALCAMPVIAAQWSLTDLLSARSAVVEAHASFTQDRYSLLLDEPLRSTGRLYYRAPDFLLQETDAPFASRKILDGETLRMWRNGKDVSMSLRHSPRVGLYARALRGVLGGRLDDMGEGFRISLSGSEQDWVLRLTLRDDLPENDGRDRNRASFAPTIEIHGQREQLRRIALRESATERTVMEIREAR